MGEERALSVIEQYPDGIKNALYEIRRLILETAAETDGAGRIVETVKWGQPSYLTERPKSGTTIRIDRDMSGPGDVVFYVSCNTSLVSEWRGLFPDLTFGGDRSVHFSLAEPLPESELRQMIGMALTYHSRKKTGRRQARQ
jgi:hypothetical protein